MPLLLHRLLFLCLLIGQNIQNTVKSSSVSETNKNQSNEVIFGTSSIPMSKDDKNQSKICKRPICSDDFEEKSLTNPVPGFHVKKDEDRPKSVSISDYRKLSILYAMINVMEEADVNLQCQKELEMIQHGVNTKDIWAVKAVDASAKPSSGFIWGNNFWLGSQKGCESLNEPLSITLSPKFPRIMKSELISSVSPFPVKYLVAHARHTSPWQVDVKFLEESVLHLGLCLPMSCQTLEIHNLTQTFFDARQDDFQVFYEMEAEVLEIRDLQVRDNFMWKRSVIMLLTIFGVTAILHFLSYLVKDNMDIFAENKQDERIFEQTSTGINKERILTSFSIEKNLETIFNSNLERETFPIIGGLKTICSLVIVVFHVQWFKFFTLDNPYIMFHNGEQVRYQWIANAPLLVDMFFVISGFLLAFNYFKNTRQNAQIQQNSLWSNIKMFLKLIAKRYVRLTPVYLVVSFLTEIGTSYLTDVSIFHLQERTDLNCQRYWWRNVFYIQNLYPHEELCANWTWSTACEMQYFVFFTLIYFIYVKNERVGKALFLVAAGTALAIANHKTFKHRFMPSFDILWDSGTDLYISPLTRAAPYFVGIGAGYLVMFYRGKLVLNKNQAQLVWCISLLTIFLCMHSTVDRDFGAFVSSITLIYARWLFAFGNAWVLISSSMGYGNWITRFLSHKYFIYFSRTTYSFYLVNPLLITIIYGLTDSASHSDTAMGIIVSLGVIFLTYVLSIVFSVSFEMPYCKLLNFRSKARTKTTSPPLSSDTSEKKPLKCD